MGQAGETLVNVIFSAKDSQCPRELIMFPQWLFSLFGLGSLLDLEIWRKGALGTRRGHLFSPASFFKFGIEGNIIWDNYRARKRVLGKSGVFNPHPGCLFAVPFVITHLVLIWPGGR